MNTTTNTLRPATREDAISLSKKLRAKDVQEIFAASGMQPLEALFYGVVLSKPHAWVLCDSADVPYVIGGVRHLKEGVGLVWLLASPQLEQNSVSVHRAVKTMLSRVWEDGSYQVLCNIVAAESKKTVRWLQRLGFTIVHKNQPVGQKGALFHSFAMSRQRQSELTYV